MRAMCSLQKVIGLIFLYLFTCTYVATTIVLYVIVSPLMPYGHILVCVYYVRIHSEKDCVYKAKLFQVKSYSHS